MSKKNLPAVPAPSDLAESPSLGDMLGLPVQATVHELFEAAAQADNASTLWRVRFGACLNRIQAELNTSANVRTFDNELEIRGFDRRRSFEAMKMAAYIESLPPPERQRMLKVQVTKLIELSKADPEVVADLLETGAIDGDHPLSVRDLRQRVVDAERKAANAEARAEQAELERESALSHSSALDTKSGFPAWLRNLRVGVMSECEGMHERLDVIDNLVLTGLLPQIGDLPDDALLREAGAVTALQALHGIAARVARLYARVVDSHPDGALDDANPLARMSDAEIAKTVAARERLFDEAGYQRRLREHQQASEKPRGRGRPKKADAPPAKPKKKG